MSFINLFKKKKDIQTNQHYVVDIQGNNIFIDNKKINFGKFENTLSVKEKVLIAISYKLDFEPSDLVFADTAAIKEEIEKGYLK